MSLVAIHNSSSTDPVYQANPTHNTARKNYYGISAYPTLMVGGLYDAWPISTMPGYYDTRMAVPCYLDISITPSSGSSAISGTLTFTLATDQGLDTDATIHAIINECGIPGTGTYLGSDFNYALRWNMAGADGTPVSFGSTSETINMDMDYTIDPSWVWNELYLTTFIQNNTTDEIFNSHMVKLTDLVTTGIEGSTAAEGLVPDFTVVSPAQGAISFSTTSVVGTGTMSLYSLNGRLVDTMQVQSGTGVFTPEVSGVYILRLDTPGGFSTNRSVVLIR
ncbi:MAG: T9SS type A sorting domain-containing protein [Candidatus Aegiribacteria sp.]|nr:T9SS type A sorting domain-containing protein [Candidatus Aegiribacteria sp.]